MRAPLWVDTDLALGAARGDVDDGFALAAVVLAGAEILGVSAVSGNTDAATAYGCARDLLDVLGAGCPVVPEADAPAALAALPAGASVLAIGPPGNLLRAAALDPGWPARVEVRVVGRVRSRLRHPLLPLFDLNLGGREARRLWSAPFSRLSVFPLDVVRRLRLDGRDLERLRGLGPAGEYLARHSRRWLARAPLRYLARSFPAWDLVAALDAVGRLPGARFDRRLGRSGLAGFDVAGARAAFFALPWPAASPAERR